MANALRCVSSPRICHSYVSTEMGTPHSSAVVGLRIFPYHVISATFVLGWIIQHHPLMQGAAVSAVHIQRRVRDWSSVLAGTKLINARKIHSWVDGVTSGTWMLMQVLGLGPEIEGLLASNRRVVMQEFTYNSPRWGIKRLLICWTVCNTFPPASRSRIA